jgi:phosphoglycerol transferase MdoB-like AlkP superfamily enzyme
MKNLLLAFLKYFLFWLTYFVLSKSVFLLYNFDLTRSLTISEISGIFVHGMKMDLSMTSYLMLVPGILLSFSFLLKPKILSGIFRVYTFLLLILITSINLLDLGLYPHWGTRVSVSAFDYIGDPQGFTSSITWKNVVAAISLFFLFIGLFVLFFKRFIKESIEKSATQKWYLFPLMIFATALLFIPIRGGLGTSPINFSTVSFSNELYVNHSSYNFLWHFLKTVERKKKMVNPCSYFDSNVAYDKFNFVENQRINSDSLLVEINNDNPPNVVLIILESFSNKVISSFGGKYDVCPNLDSICAESIIFPSFYASGNRSDRGMAAILGSYPSLLTQSIINYPEKSKKLTLMSDYFNRNAYWTSFYYGGDIDFYNLKSLILQGEFKDIVGQKDFPKEIRDMSSWGAPDGYLFDKVLNEIDKPQPFFTVAYTLSSHTPYDVPAQIIKGESTENKYLNSVAYTDSCLGDFIRSFKKTKYWDNSLVIITADHGHLHPGPTEIIEPATYRIPLIWTGGVVKNPAVINEIFGQPDLIPTIIKQFGWKRDSSLFGHDVFSTPQYAFYMWDTGWGYISEEGEFIYDQNTEQFRSFETTGNAEPNYDFAKSYLQVLHEDFLKK